MTAAQGTWSWGAGARVGVSCGPLQETVRRVFYFADR